MWWFGYHLLSTPRRVERPAAVSGLTRRQPWADLWLLLVFVLCCCHVRDRWKRSHRRLVVDCSSENPNVKDLSQDRRAQGIDVQRRRAVRRNVPETRVETNAKRCPAL